MKEKLRHFTFLGIAWFLIAVGLLFLISPIPIGIFFIALGLSLLIYTSDTVTHKLRNFRQKHKKFDIQLVWIEGKLANRIAFVSTAMRKTRPIVEEKTHQY